MPQAGALPTARQQQLTTAKLNTSDARVAPSPCSMHGENRAGNSQEGREKGVPWKEAGALGYAALPGSPAGQPHSRQLLCKSSQVKSEKGGRGCPPTFITSGASQRCSKGRWRGGR